MRVIDQTELKFVKYRNTFQYPTIPFYPEDSLKTTESQLKEKKKTKTKTRVLL